jgi:hypothetical protein
MKIILGGGIAGLIYAYYHKDHMILTDQIGGQMVSQFSLGPRYLHDKSEAVRKFLNELNVPIEKRVINVGYIGDDGWINDPDLDFRKKYFMKSRGTKSLTGFDPTVLNTNQKQFEICEVDFRNLIVQLFDHVSSRLYHGKAEKIDLKERLIHFDSSKTIMKYESLVSTIPLNIFCKIANINMQLESTNMAYCLIKENAYELKNFDFVYDIRSTTSFHRMTKCNKGIVCDVLETNISNFLESNSQFLEFPKDDAIRVIKNSQIISLEKDFEIEDKSVKFIGRYGTWNRRWKTETVIEEAQKT